MTRLSWSTRSRVASFASLPLLAALVLPACAGDEGEVRQEASPVATPAARASIAMKMMVPMPDGTRLATRVYVPSGTKPVPTLLVRNPYPHVDDDATIAEAASFHNARGYAYVWQSVRGTAGSEGTFYPYVDEVRDGVATTEWITAQPWSDGGVGTMGGSYLGFTALAAAVDNPRVKVVISDEGTPDERSSHRGGVVWGYLLNWLHLVQDGYFLDDAAINPEVTNALDVRALDARVLGKPSPYWRDFLANVDEPLFPLAGSLEPLFRRLCVPILHVYSPSTDWTDPIDIHRGVTTQGCAEARARQRLYVVAEPHTHHLTRLGTERTYVTEAMLSALDRLLKDHGTDLGPGPAVSYAVVGEATPREAATWPPPGATQTFHLRAAEGEGVLATSPTPAGEVSISSDPNADPCAGTPPGSTQWFTTAGLQQPMVIAGRAKLTLSVRSELRDFDLFATLYDYDPRKGSYAQISSAQARSHSPRGSATAPLIPERRTVVDLEFVDAAHRIAAGHMLTVSLSPSKCGYAKNAQTGAPVTATFEPRAGALTLQTGVGSSSALSVPTVLP